MGETRRGECRGFIAVGLIASATFWDGSEYTFRRELRAPLCSFRHALWRRKRFNQLVERIPPPSGSSSSVPMLSTFDLDRVIESVDTFSMVVSFDCCDFRVS